MTTIRRFCCNDLLRFASVNLDHLTETVSVSSTYPFNTILNLMVPWLIVFLVSVQHVLLHDLSCKMARLFSCCWRSWKSNHGLQWVFAFAFSLTRITICNSHLGWFHFHNEISYKIEAWKWHRVWILNKLKLKKRS